MCLRRGLGHGCPGSRAADARGVGQFRCPGVGARYEGTHVYVAPADMAPFVASFIATFGGEASKPATTTVTPTPSSTSFAAVRMRARPLSVFAFTTPIPYPFGAERTGYLVKDLDAAVSAARAAGTDVIVAPFPPYRPRRGDPVAGRGQHAALLAYDQTLV